MEHETKMENLLKKIDWAEIAGECLNNTDDLVGYEKAMVMYDMYDAREEARAASERLETWNKTAKSTKHTTVHDIDWSFEDDTDVQNAYRDMVRANSLVKGL